MGKGKVPEEISDYPGEPAHHDDVPEAPSDISDRRNHLAGNLSLQHELQVIEMVNALLQEGALTPAFRARFGLDTTERITVRFIRMSAEIGAGARLSEQAVASRPAHRQAARRRRGAGERVRRRARQRRTAAQARRRAKRPTTPNHPGRDGGHDAGARAGALLWQGCWRRRPAPGGSRRGRASPSPARRPEPARKRRSLPSRRPGLAVARAPARPPARSIRRHRSLALFRRSRAAGPAAAEAG